MIRYYSADRVDSYLANVRSGLRDAVAAAIAEAKSVDNDRVKTLQLVDSTVREIEDSLRGIEEYVEEELSNSLVVDGDEDVEDADEVTLFEEALGKN